MNLLVAAAWGAEPPHVELVATDQILVFEGSTPWMMEVGCVPARSGVSPGSLQLPSDEDPRLAGAMASFAASRAVADLRRLDRALDRAEVTTEARAVAEVARWSLAWRSDLAEAEDVVAAMASVPAVTPGWGALHVHAHRASGDLGAWLGSVVASAAAEVVDGILCGPDPARDLADPAVRTWLDRTLDAKDPRRIHLLVAARAGGEQVRIGPAWTGVLEAARAAVSRCDEGTGPPAPPPEVPPGAVPVTAEITCRSNQAILNAIIVDLAEQGAIVVDEVALAPHRLARRCAAEQRCHCVARAQGRGDCPASVVACVQPVFGNVNAVDVRPDVPQRCGAAP